MSVKSANKEILSSENKGKGLEEDLKKLNLKEDKEGCLVKEGGKMTKQDPMKTGAKEQEKKTTGKGVIDDEQETLEVIANKEAKAEVGPEEFLKHPLQVSFIDFTAHILSSTCLLSRMLGPCGSLRMTRRAHGKRIRGPSSLWLRYDCILFRKHFTSSSILKVTIAQVEDFWSLYNHVSLASNLPPGSDYSFFKVGKSICNLSVRKSMILI